MGGSRASSSGASAARASSSGASAARAPEAAHRRIGKEPADSDEHSFEFDDDDDDEVCDSTLFTAGLSEAMSRALPVRVGSIGMALAGNDASRRRTIKSIRNHAQAELTLSGGFMAFHITTLEWLAIRSLVTSWCWSDR